MQHNPANQDHGLESPWLEAIPGAVVALDPRGCVLASNSAAHALLGVPGEVLGEEPFTAVLAEPERGGFAEVLALVLTGVPWTGRLRVGCPGSSRLVQARLAPVQVEGAVIGGVLSLDGGGAGAEAAAHPSERLTKLARVAGELQGSEDLKTLADVVVTHLADAAGATTASVSVLVDEQTMALVGLRGGIPGAASRWATFPFDDTTPAGVCLRTREPLLLSGREAMTAAFPELDLVADGEGSLLCLPLLAADRPLGVVSLSFPGHRALDAAELEYHRIMANNCAQALDRIQAVETAADQNAKLRFLAEASAELSRSLDYEATLRNIAWLAVPDFADWCSISLDQDGILRTLAVAHKDPHQLALAQEFERRYPPDPDTPGGAYDVLRSGQTSLIPEITDEMLAASGAEPVRVEMVRTLNLRSAMTVALQARGRIFGTMTWVSGEAGRRFGPDDVPFGEDLARRAATAIDNALLHSDLREIAERLQQAVHPPEMPEIEGWRLTASYSSAGRVSVGGDFYDAIPLQDGRIAVAIGDVMGRGVQAAAAMSQIRAALRAFIAVDPEPDVVMNRLDLLHDRFPTEQLVTLLYGVADPRTGELTLACAGHPPPLLIAPDGAAEFIEAAHGTLLGVGRSHRPTTVVPFPPGHTLLMFTDGLIERRGEDLEVSKLRLLDACNRMSVGTEIDLDRLAEVMRDPARDDDVALLAVHRVERQG